MDIINRCDRIANSYYNFGLEQAKRRDLTGAANSLKKALEFNKDHTDARNLLGLIYYETGEVADALVQWVISLNLNPIPNDADRYLDEIQRKQGKLEAYGRVIEKYNQALAHAQTGSDDLAILELSGAVESNPRYVRALLLSALLYMSHEEYEKARKCLLRVQLIDKNNPKALWYMSELKIQTGRAEKEKKKIGKVLSHKKMEDDDVIIPSSYKESTGWQTIVNIGVGLLIGAVAVVFLYMPTRVARIQNTHSQELLAVSDELDTANKNIGELQSELDSKTADYDSLTQQWNTSEETNNYRLTQYQLLIGILQDYRQNNLSQAAELYSSLDASQLIDIDDGSGVSVTGIYNEISGQLNEEGYVSLCNQGDESYDAGDYEGAINYYDKSLTINPEYVRAMYSKATAYKALGDLQTANSLFGDIIINYSDSEYAGRAKEQRGY